MFSLLCSLNVIHFFIFISFHETPIFTRQLQMSRSVIFTDTRKTPIHTLLILPLPLFAPYKAGDWKTHGQSSLPHRCNTNALFRNCMQTDDDNRYSDAERESEERSSQIFEETTTEDFRSWRKNCDVLLVEDFILIQ